MQLNSREIKLLMKELELKQIRAKDIMRLQDITLDAAKRLYTDIKKEYGLKRPPTLFHLNKYLKIA